MQIALRQVHASLAPVERDVLPEVGKLQAGADRIGLLQKLRFAAAKQLQQQTPDRIGRAAAVIGQRLERVVADRDDVLRKRR